MSLFFRRRESRAIDATVFADDAAGFTASGDIAGRALRLVPVFAATSLLADSVASLPLMAYRSKSDGTRVRLDSYPLLDSHPETTFTWVHRAMVSLLLRGNAYGLVTQIGRDGWPTALEWLHPGHVTVDESGRPVRYFYQGREIPAELLLHVVGYAQPGTVLGLSPVSQFAATVDAGLSVQAAVRDWYANGSTPSQQLRNRERAIDPATAQTAKERFRASVRTGDPFVTGADWELTPLGVSAQDAQFLDAIKANATQVAAIYRIPPEKIGGEVSSSMTYATVEQQSLDFITYSLRTWMVRLEQSLSTLMPRGVRASFRADAMVRTDTKTRMDTHRTALDAGIRTQDEVRALEDLPPLTDEQKAEWMNTYRATSAGRSADAGTDGSTQ